jgi:23S rRNA pseudouridine2605 synthase
VTTHKDPQGRPTVFDAVAERLPRVISIGRLDLTTEGLLLLTNDGALARQLELPGNAWVRRYRIRANGRTDQAALDALGLGVEIDGVTYKPIKASLDQVKGANVWITASITEGKNREIRKVMEHLGLTVNRLIRTSFGPFQLGALPAGDLEEVPAKQMKEQLGAKASAALGMEGMANVVSLNRVRKKKAAASTDKRADENRAKFGRTKADRTRERAEKARAAKALDGAKRDE